MCVFEKMIIVEARVAVVERDSMVDVWRGWPSRAIELMGCIREVSRKRF
jgi:hypothetical protein